MMNNNKILTVSYGTFSCTLEGFDDSFGTMKAIAEYFRDLASEDRYFGAEPPQPDAEMLAHIAQREISRRVEAREQDGRIVLSARSAEAEPPAAPEPKRHALTAPAGSSYVSSSFAPRRPNEISAYYDAYRLNTLKQTAGASPAPVEVPEANATEAEAPQTSQPAETAQDSALKADAATPAGDPIVDGQADAFFADSPTDADATNSDNSADIAPAIDAAPTLAATPAAADLKPDSIAAKLQRIRAVVSRQETETAKRDYTEDEHAEDTLGFDDAGDDEAAAQDRVADAIHDIEEAFGADDAADADQTEAENAEDEDDLENILSRLEAGSADTAPDEDAILPSDDKTEDAKTADAPAPRGRVIKVKRADLDRAIAKGDLEEYKAEAPEEAVETEAAETESDAVATQNSEDQNTADQETADQNAADQETSDQETETVAETPDAAHEVEAARTSSLSPEEEEELARELAEVEAALNGDLSDDADDAYDTDQTETDQADDTDASDVSARRTLPMIDDAQGSDINRLLAETDHQMDDPESATRRNAITHLRAAVAAKKADVALGAAEREEDDNAYRNDLAEVVRPRRPVSSTSRTERPADTRPAPLKLVAEQRIDTDRPQPAMPVRPRRVAAVASVPSAASNSFAEFAADAGAVTLTELLEAAAAYMAFVEGLDQFSRPQLMSTVRQINQEDFSREDGLRSFGMLLRSGKIHKLDGGRFRASEDIGFQPDNRAAG